MTLLIISTIIFRMLEEFQAWKRRKNLFTFTKLAVLITVVLTIRDYSDKVTSLESNGVIAYMVIVTLLIVAYRKFQHEPYVKSQRLERRNDDFSLKPWEFTFPRKFWEAGKLMSIKGKVPLLGIAIFAFVLSPVFIASRLEIPSFAKEAYEFVFILPEPEINFALNGNKAPLATLINEPSVFWIWDEDTSIGQSSIFFQIAEDNPDIQFYTARSYGNLRGAFNEFEGIPENIQNLDPYGFNLGDSSLLENEVQEIVIFDTEGTVIESFDDPNDLSTINNLESLFVLE